VPPPDGDPRGRSARPVRGPSRLPRAIRALEPEQRIAAAAALALWISMFLPWYGKSVTETVQNSLRAAGYDLSAFGAFSFVEAAVLLVASAVLALLFARAEHRAFHLPGGDGLVILAGGIWVSVLIFYRMLDKPGTTGNDRLTTTVGLQWGIFFALAASLSLAYAGARVRTAHRPEPALRDDPTVAPGVVARPTPARPARPTRSTRPPRRGGAGQSTPAGARPDAPGQASPPRPSPLPPPPTPARRAVPPPFDAAADGELAGEPPAAGFDPPPDTRRVGGLAGEETVDLRGRPPRPADEDPPTRVVRRVPRFDDLDAEWISPDQLSLEGDPPTAEHPTADRPSTREDER
jgi:hypothetical protein